MTFSLQVYKKARQRLAKFCKESPKFARMCAAVNALGIKPLPEQFMMATDHNPELFVLHLLAAKSIRKFKPEPSAAKFVMPYMIAEPVYSDTTVDKRSKKDPLTVWAKERWRIAAQALVFISNSETVRYQEVASSRKEPFDHTVYFSLDLLADFVIKCVLSGQHIQLKTRRSEDYVQLPEFEDPDELVMWMAVNGKAEESKKLQQKLAAII